MLSPFRSDPPHGRTCGTLSLQVHLCHGLRPSRWTTGCVLGFSSLNLRAGELRKRGLQSAASTAALPGAGDAARARRPGHQARGTSRRNSGPRTRSSISTTGSTRRSTKSVRPWATPPRVPASWKLWPVAATASSLMSELPTVLQFAARNPQLSLILPQTLAIARNYLAGRLPTFTHLLQSRAWKISTFVLLALPGRSRGLEDSQWEPFVAGHSLPGRASDWRTSRAMRLRDYSPMG